MSQITQIEAWAMEIAGVTNPIAPTVRALIVEWSAFVPEPGKTITIGAKTLDQISPAYIRSIWFRARKAMEAHRKAIGGSLNLELGDAPKVAQKGRKRPSGARERLNADWKGAMRHRPAPPYDPSAAGESRMPAGEGYDNTPEDLPF